MKLLELLSHYAKQLNEEREIAMSRGLDAPIDIPKARYLRTTGSLHLYSLELPDTKHLIQDVPVTILPSNNSEPTEGIILEQRGREVLIQSLDPFGTSVQPCTLIPDTSGFLETGSARLDEMTVKPESYTLGPADRLVPWCDPNTETRDPGSRSAAATSVLTTFWGDNQTDRWTKLSTLLVDLVKKNKRVLLISPNHQSLDQLTGTMARALRTAALPFKSLLSRYEMSLLTAAAGMSLPELGFEAHMYQFYAKANANKTALRKKYERFRELTPILAYKREKQKDLNEVKLLEWRLLTQLSEWQGKIKNIDKTVADYEAIPIWKRLAMQAAGKNVETLCEYRTLYEHNIQALMKEVEIAQQRIRELTPEATIPKDMRPEYDELKEEITRLGGTKKIRDMLTANEGTNRQAFAQNKRILATTAGRVLTDPLFKRVRFDVLIVDDAIRIPAPLLLGTAGIIRERIVLSGDTQHLTHSSSNHTPQELGLWPQECLPTFLDSEPQPSNVG